MDKGRSGSYILRSFVRSFARSFPRLHWSFFVRCDSVLSSGVHTSALECLLFADTCGRRIPTHNVGLDVFPRVFFFRFALQYFCGKEEKWCRSITYVFLERSCIAYAPEHIFPFVIDMSVAGFKKRHLARYYIIHWILCRDKVEQNYIVLSSYISYDFFKLHIKYRYDNLFCCSRSIYCNFLIL